MFHIVIPIGLALIAFYIALKAMKRGHSYGEMTTSQGKRGPRAKDKLKVVLGHPENRRALKKAPSIWVESEKVKQTRVTLRRLMGSTRRNRRFDLLAKRRGLSLSDFL
ncbi:hypothetical protein MTO96_020168 [Rhipicephalus appendiculatus]